MPIDGGWVMPRRFRENKRLELVEMSERYRNGGELSVAAEERSN